MAKPEQEGYEPQEPNFTNLAENKSRLSRHQRIILGAGSIAVATSGLIVAARAAGYIDSEPSVTSDDSHSQNLENTPTSVAEFTVTTPSGETATFTTPSPTPEQLTPTPETKPTEQPTKAPEVTPSAEYAPYDSLITKISSSTLSEQEKQESITQIEQIKLTEKVQKQLLSAYNTELGPDGKTPALLYYTKLRYPNIPTLTPESQIFILQNQKILDTEIAPKIKTLNETFDPNTLKNTLEQISYNAGHVYNPDGPYFGLNVSLSDYSYLSESLTPAESQTKYENLTPTQIESLKVLESELAPLVGNFTIFGTKGFELNYFQGPSGNKYELHINPDNQQSARHEWSHATNIEQNKSIAGSLTPEELVKLATLHEKALTDPVYGRQYATLNQLFTSYSEINRYTAGASSYPFETFVTNTNASGPEKMYKVEPHTFAVNKLTGVKMTDADIVKILELQPKQYKDTKEFVNAKLPQLEKLAQTAPFFAPFVEMLKKDPATMDKLASKIGKNSIANYHTTTEGDYLRFFVEYYCDSSFTVGLLNGQPEMVKIFTNLTKEDQKLLLTNSLAILQHADHETWAENSRFSIESPNPAPRTDNPYTDYYAFLKLSLKK